MFRSVYPACLKDISALTGGWLDHSALQGPKLTTVAVNAVAKGAAGWHNVLR